MLKQERLLLEDSERAFTANEYRLLLSSLNEDWGNYLILKVTNELVRRAGDLAEKHALRGFDAIHLSSAVNLCQDFSAPVVFSCSDRKLQKASELEDLEQPQ
jgi:hypothetical protein